MSRASSWLYRILTTSIGHRAREALLKSSSFISRSKKRLICSKMSSSTELEGRAQDSNCDPATSSDDVATQGISVGPGEGEVCERVEVCEGQAKILFPSHNEVFYNKVQEFNRDLR